MNKKAFLSTVLVILLLLPLIILGKTAADAASRQRSAIITTDGGMRALYHYDDIVDDYESLVGLSVDNIIFEGDGGFWVNYTNIGLLEENATAKKFASYADWMERTYAPLINLILNVSEPPTQFNLSPYNYKLLVGPDLYFMTGDDVSEQWRNLDKIIIRVRINQTLSNRTYDNSPPNNGNVEVECNIIGSDGNETLDDTTAEMKPNGANQPFEVRFNDGSWIKIELEKYNFSDGTLHTSSSGLEVIVDQLSIRYETNGTTPEFSADGVINILQPGNVNKTTNAVMQATT